MTLKLFATLATACRAGSLVGFRGQNTHGTYEAMTPSRVRLRVGLVVLDAEVEPGNLLDLEEVTHFCLLSGTGLVTPRGARPSRRGTEVVAASAVRLTRPRH